MKFAMNCPGCGHDAMHYGEPAEVAGGVVFAAFSCRACGAAFEPGELREIAEAYLAALAAIEAPAAGAPASTLGGAEPSP